LNGFYAVRFEPGLAVRGKPTYWQPDGTQVVHFLYYDGERWTISPRFDVVQGLDLFLDAQSGGNKGLAMSGPPEQPQHIWMEFRNEAWRIVDLSIDYFFDGELPPELQRPAMSVLPGTPGLRPLVGHQDSGQRLPGTPGLPPLRTADSGQRLPGTPGPSMDERSAKSSLKIPFAVRGLSEAAVQSSSADVLEVFKPMIQDDDAEDPEASAEAEALKETAKTVSWDEVLAEAARGKDKADKGGGKADKGGGKDGGKDRGKGKEKGKDKGKDKGKGAWKGAAESAETTEEKLERWVAAKRARDFRTSDALRYELRAEGIDPDKVFPDSAFGKGHKGKDKGKDQWKGWDGWGYKGGKQDMWQKGADWDWGSQKGADWDWGSDWGGAKGPKGGKGPKGPAVGGGKLGPGQGAGFVPPDSPASPEDDDAAQFWAESLEAAVGNSPPKKPRLPAPKIDDFDLLMAESEAASQAAAATPAAPAAEADAATAAAPEAASSEELNGLSQIDLRQKLANKGLPTYGSKEQMIDRLLHGPKAKAKGKAKATGEPKAKGKAKAKGKRKAAEAVDGAETADAAEVENEKKEEKQEDKEEEKKEEKKEVEDDAEMDQMFAASKEAENTEEAKSEEPDAKKPKLEDEASSPPKASGRGRGKSEAKASPKRGAKASPKRAKAKAKAKAKIEEEEEDGPTSEGSSGSD